MISYAQNAEDVLLNRLFPADYLGFYVDIGANDPTAGSITKHFYDRGWSGINVEPAGIFERLSRERPRDINLNLAISDASGRARLFDYPEASCNATLSRAVAAGNEQFAFDCQPREVDVITLRQLCEQYLGERTVDFMSIDVEGHERAVIVGGDWRRFRPRVLVIEATFPHTPRPSHMGWEALLLEHDYFFAIFDGLNRFYVRGEDVALLPLLAAPACVHDKYVPYIHQSAHELLAAPWRLVDHLRMAHGDSFAIGAGMRLARLLHLVGNGLPALSRSLRRLQITKRGRRAAG
jgi:FkbM family methyltransferase